MTFKNTAVISGRVVTDSNNDFTEKAAVGFEAGIDGVKVELLNKYGHVIKTTYTDHYGAYRFDKLDDGEYFVRVPAAIGEATLVPKDVGAPTEDSDANADGKTDKIKLDDGEVQANVDFVYGMTPDGIVDGEASGELMTVGYDDANAPTNGGGDKITNGDDIIEGNGGNDSIYAGGGSDSVLGGDGNDVIYGDSAAPGTGPGAGATTVRESFEWDKLPDPSGDKTAIDNRDTFTSATQDTGNVTVTFTKIAFNKSPETSFSTDTQKVHSITADGAPVNANSSLSSLLNADDESATYRWAFDTPVSNLSFRINDIDFSSIVTIKAYDVDGKLVPISIDAGSKIKTLDQDGVGGTEKLVANSGSLSNDPPDTTPEYSALVNVAGPIARIEINHTMDAHLSNGNAGINITDMYFDVVTGPVSTGNDDTLDGGAGDDLIFGEAGDDLIKGGAGNDILNGGTGDDTIYGDTGDALSSSVEIRIGDGSASFTNQVFAYTIDPTTLAITNVQVLTANAATAEGSVFSYTTVPGAVIGVGIISPEGTFYSSGYGPNLGLNADGKLHTKGLGVNPDGSVTIGFEDLKNLGDKDFNDVVVTVDLKQSGTTFDNAHYAYSAPLAPDMMAGDDQIDGGDGDDVIYGNGGNDTLTGGAGADKLIGGAGNDVFLASGTAVNDGDIIIGGNGPDQDTDNDVLDLRGAGKVTIAQSADETDNGAVKGTVTFSDGSVLTFSQIETILTDPQNTAPVATDDVAVTDEDTAVTINVLGNDTDVDGDTLTVTGATVPSAQGTVVVNPNGTITFTPAANYNGPATITYTVSDGNGGTDTGTVAVTVNPVNDAPVATDDVATTPFQTPVTVNVLANDTDVDGDLLSVANATVPAAQGTVVVNPNGTVTFNPAAGFAGAAVISYTVSDGNGGFDTGTLTVTVGADPRDGIVEGTEAGEFIGTNSPLNPGFTYTGDPDGDLVDSNDALLPGEAPNDDIILAGGGNDTVDAGLGDDEVSGGTGDDVIYGRDGDDSLSGDAGNDVLFGGDGDDTIDGGDGKDSIDGGDGDDSLSGGDGADIIFGGAGNDTIDGGLNADLLDGGDGDDLIIGENGEDTLLGGAGNDTLIGGTGGDVMDGGSGDDSIIGNTGRDTINGGADNDFIDAGLGEDLIDGGDGNDTILGGGDSDTIDGGDGKDSIDGGDGDDSLSGGDGADTIFGGAGNDTIDGGLNADLLDGGDGDDLIIGDNGEDTLLGGAGNDTLIGGTGGDVMDGGSGDDSIIGNTGRDTIMGGAGNDTIDGGLGEDLIDGGDGDDVIFGGPDSDTIDGGAGNDTIIGGNAADILRGGDDSDTFIGGTDGDVIDGGSGGIDFDTLDLRGAAPVGGSLKVTITGPDSNGNGSDGFVTYQDQNGNVTGTFQFFEIEEIIPCFTPGTLIATPRGERLVEDLRVGDKVITRDNGLQEIRWIGAKTLNGVDIARNPHMKPVLIKAGALGNGLPERDTLYSPNHRVLVNNEKTALYFDEREVLVAAKHLVGAAGIHEVNVMGTTYIHFMFDHHEVVLSNGSWTESFQPGDMALKGVGEAQRAEILTLFPDLQTGVGGQDFQSARRSLKKHEARLLLK